MQSEVFLDAAYAIALSAPSDQLHERAVALAQQLEAGQTRMVTTQAVLLEIGNALSKRRYRAAAVELLSSLEADPSIEVVAFSRELYTEAFDLYRSRLDKEWGLIDCASFVAMIDDGRGYVSRRFMSAAIRTPYLGLRKPRIAKQFGPMS